MAISYVDEGLTYEEYQSLGGCLEEIVFQRKLISAITFLKIQTYQRIANTEIDNEIKICIFDLIELEEKSKIASEGNDGISISYNVASLDTPLRIISKYLTHKTDKNGTPLLYKGVFGANIQ